MRWLRRAAILIAVTVFSVAALAQEAKLEEPLETRARALFTELRCVVCQNQSIDSSDADVAKDLRAIVREQISTGKSDSQIKNFLVARYGEFVLLKPAMAWHTLVLWFAPLVLLVVGGVMAWISMRRRRAMKTVALSGDEEARLEALLNPRED